MNLPKPMQHHSMPPRPQHMRHPMHQGPMHPGHPPPHMTINMGPPPPQQQPHHMPNAPAPRGPPPQQFGMPQMRDQNRLSHHQHAQQHPQQRLNNQMQQQNQLQHHKGRPPHVGGGGIPQGPLQQANMQKNVPSMRNNALPNHQSQQAQQPRIPPPQQIPLNGGCGGPQMQILKGPSQPPLQQQQQIQLAQHHKVNAMQQVPPNHLNPQQIPHMQAQAVPIPQQPPPQQQQQQQLQQRHTQHHQQYHQKQQQNVHHRTPQRQHQQQQQPQQHQQQQQQQPNRQQQKFSHPRAILQNPNRVNNQLNGNVSIPTPLPTVTEVESAVISSTPAQNASSGTVVSEQLSATAEDFTPQSSQVTVSEEKSDNESSGLINDILSVVMKGDGCFSNSKEKTPMCLVNELARYNKIQHQYRLTSENGPAHCKRFTVTLKLGDEEYSAEGYKIKKAQHTAAAEAIKKTKYKHPLPKAIRRPEESLRTTITPTVELNALAMKLGQQTYYVFDPRSQPDSSVNGTDTQFSQSPNQFSNSRMPRNATYPPSTLQQQQRFPAGRGFAPKYPGPGRIPSVNGVAGVTPQMANGTPPEMCKITLIVGKQKFVGTGRTLQSAKHDAASRALQVLKTQAANKFKEILTRTAEEGDWKSPISLVHEIAIKRNLTVTFKVLREEGPAHMKNFITTCEVGNIVTEGDGNGKKISKKRAAEKMLEELKKLPPPSPSKSPPVKRIKVKNFKRKTSPTPKKKGSSSIREKTESECAEDANPISRLIQIQQSRNEKEPAYELISRGGESKKREFVMEVNVPGNVARGTGASKKLAKRSAAHNLLIAMGIEVEETGNEENNSQIANQNPDTKVTRKVKFSETNSTCEASDAIVTPQSGNGGPSGRQIVPGVLLLRQHSKDSDETENLDTPTTASAAEVPKSVSPPAKNKSPISNTETSNSVRPKDQLMYLAQILGFQANFSDYPKGNHSEFLTIVTLSTAPPQICHGVGLNTEESQDQAASAALQILSKLGLDNIKPKSDG